MGRNQGFIEKTQSQPAAAHGGEEESRERWEVRVGLRRSFALSGGSRRSPGQPVSARWFSHTSLCPRLECKKQGGQCLCQALRGPQATRSLSAPLSAWPTAQRSCEAQFSPGVLWRPGSAGCSHGSALASTAVGLLQMAALGSIEQSKAEPKASRGRRHSQAGGSCPGPSHFLSGKKSSGVSVLALANQPP